MALVLADRVKVRSRSTGTGTFTLENPVTGYQSFAVIGNGNDTYYGIVDARGNWEIGQGTYTTIGTTLSRNTVISSSNSGNLVNFAAGSKNVYCTFPSSVLNLEATDGDRLVNGLNELILDTNGALIYPNVALQRDTATVQCLGNASAVVYTASGQYRHTIRLLIQVEGSVPGEQYETQSCEMIIAKSFRGNDIASSVYGVVHTSDLPLATFTAVWNGLTNRVDVVCTASSEVDVYVRTFATEITTSD